MQHFNIDIDKPNGFLVLYSKQADSMSRFFSVSLFSGGAEWEPPEGSVLTVRFGAPGMPAGWYDTITEPDGGSHSAFSVDGNTVTVELAEQAVSAPGTNIVSLLINGADGYQLASWNFTLQIELVPGLEAPEATVYYNALTEQVSQTLANANAAAASADAAAQSAAEAAASAASIDPTKLVNITGGTTGQFPQISGSGYQWADVNQVPQGGAFGQVLTATGSGYQWSDAPVQSVNGKTGAVELSAEDVKARPDSWMPSAGDVGAIPKDNAKTLASGITWGSGSTLTPEGWDDYAIIQLSSNYGRAIIRRLPKNGSTFALFASNIADYINITCVTVTRNSTGGSLALSILTSLRLSTNGITKNVTEFNIYQIDGLV